jgi:hypothetical protein
MMYADSRHLLDLAKQHQAEIRAEVDRHRLASNLVERRPSRTVAVLTSVVTSLKSVVSRRPVVVRQTQLQPTS